MQGAIFDATTIPPDQGGTSHPVGKFPFGITGTDIKPTKDNDGHYFEVEYTTPQGKISQRFNLWNNSAQAVEIAHKQLSALCHATGVYRLDMNNKGAELLNARGMIEIRQQRANPNYTEVARIYDANGNEPGKAPATTQPQPSQPQAQPFNQPNTAPPAGQPWGNNAASNNASQPQPSQPSQPQGQPWAPGGNAAPPATAPWGPR